MEEALDGDDLYVTNNVQQINYLDNDMIAVGQLFNGSEGGGVGISVKAAGAGDVQTAGC